MTSNEIRKSFLDFFATKEHRIVDSVQVVPYDDPTLLFINAGMNQFKDVFLGTGLRDYKRAANSQKCIRVSGKHNDLEEVGVDTYHHTFFEMLGNWSFGDYYKAEAIDFAWELLTKVWKLAPERLYATVYRTDDEAYDIWKKYLPENHIQRFDEKDNFWEMGATGPCGPCSEIHYDKTNDLSGAKLVNAGSPDVIEIWNLVFIQFNRNADGSLEPLANKFVDTGMGFERICSILQNVNSNYDTDIFIPLLQKIKELLANEFLASEKCEQKEMPCQARQDIDKIENHSETVGAYCIRPITSTDKKMGVCNTPLQNGVHQPCHTALDAVSPTEKPNTDTEKTNIAMRVIADHIRTLCIAIADGALPGNEGRNYVLRRILRRALRYARSLGFTEPMLHKLVPTVIEVMGEQFKELKTQQKTIEWIINAEEETFLQTMERGLAQIDNMMKNIKQRANSDKIICGDTAFLLYDTYGFPLDLTELIAKENGFSVDITGFYQKMEEQKTRSRSARKQISNGINLPNLNLDTTFVGYERRQIHSKIVYAKDNLIVFNKTPFYPEGGGQVGDKGKIIFTVKDDFSGNSSDFSINVIDTQKSGNTIFHILDLKEGMDIREFCKIGKFANLKVNEINRKNITRNHTATHLLHSALYKILGEHIQQTGSLVTADYLRFDFNHFEKIDREYLNFIEGNINKQILAGFHIATKIIPLEEAKKNPKIKMCFGDKYSDEVRVVSIGNVSFELCGGVHCRNTADISFLKIISESSVAAGIRRIEAVTGQAAFEYVYNLEKQFKEKNAEIDELKSQIKHYEKIEENTKKAKIANEVASMLSTKKVRNVDVFVTQMEVENIEQLRTAAEKARESGQNGICLVAAIFEDKVRLACSVSDDLKIKYPAGKLVGEAAKFLGGDGGGKPHLATAGGKDITKLNELLSKNFYEIVAGF